MVTTVVQGASRILAVISALATFALMVLVVIDVISRLLGLGSVPGLLEISEVTLVFLVFCGIAYGMQTRTHIAVTLVTSRLPEKLGRALVTLGLVVLLVVLAWALWATGNTAIQSTLRGEVRFGITQVPIWPARIMIPIGLLVLIGEVILQLVLVLKGEEEIRGEAPVAEEELAV